MTKHLIIEQTIAAINKLPENKAEEIFDFANFMLKQYEEQQLTNEILTIVEESNSFEFLHAEEDLYTLADIKEPYNG